MPDDQNQDQNQDPNDQKPQDTGPDLQSRVAALIGQRNAATDALSQLTNENQDLRTRLRAVEERLSGTPARTEPTAAPLSGDGGRKPDSQGSPDIAALVRDQVSQAIKPLVDEIAADKATHQKRQAQGKSFQTAAALMPDLMDGQSELSQLTDRILQERSDIAQLDDAPLMAAYAALGVLQGAQKAERKVAEAKRTAAIRPTHAQSRLERAAADSGPGAKAQELEQKLVEQTQTEGAGVEDFSDLFRLNLEKLRSN